MPLTSIRQYLSRKMKYIGPRVMLAVVLASIISFVAFGLTKLAAGPLYRTNNAAECRTKYAKATTLAETTTVDFLPYADSSGRRLRCGMTRSITLGDIK